MSVRKHEHNHQEIRISPILYRTSSAATMTAIGPKYVCWIGLRVIFSRVAKSNTFKFQHFIACLKVKCNTVHILRQNQYNLWKTENAWSMHAQPRQWPQLKHKIAKWERQGRKGTFVALLVLFQTAFQSFSCQANCDCTVKSAWCISVDNTVSVPCISQCDTELIRRWDSERELFTTISHTYFKIPQKNLLCLTN